MTEDTFSLDPAILAIITALARADAARDFDAHRRDQERESSRRPRVSFTHADIRRAIAAVEAAGKSVGAVDFPPSGGFRIIIGAPSSATGRNEWDDVLEDTPEQALARWMRDDERRKQETPEQARERQRRERRAASGRAKKGPF